MLCQINTVPDALMLPACERGSCESISVLKHRHWELCLRAEIPGEMQEHSFLVTPGNWALLLGASQPLSASTLLPKLPRWHHHHPAASPRCPQRVWSRAGGTRSPHGE